MHYLHPLRGKPESRGPVVVAEQEGSVGRM